MLASAMTRPSFLRIASFTLAFAASWLGCVKDESGGAPLPICPRYCDKLDESCAGLEYKDRDQCLAACALMKPGNEGDNDNTAGCRLGQAEKATKGDGASCKKASAFGGQACGNPCTTFCQLVDAICIQGNDSASKPYTSESSCVEQCASLTYDPNGDEGQKQDFAGADTLNCRMFHLLLAIDDKAGHCPHTGAVSDTCKTR